MDYGKLAYLKTQDLSEQISNMRKDLETAPYNCLSYLDKRPYSFSKDLKFIEYYITAKKLTTVNIQYKVLLKSLENTCFDFSIYINNVKAETFTDYINNESKSFVFTVVIDGFNKGNNCVSAGVQFENEGEYVVLCTEINVTGNNITELVKDRQVDVIDKFAGCYIATSRKQDSYIDLINHNFDANFVSSPSFSLEKKGDIYVFSKINLEDQEDIVDLDFYAYIDAEKNLIINLYSLIDNIIYDTKTVDSNVTKIAACQNYNPLGLSLCYIKDFEIYTSNVTAGNATAEPFCLNFSPPKMLKTIYGRIKDVSLFLNNDMAALCFVNESNNGYLKIGDIEKKHLDDFGSMFLEKTLSLGTCENCRFKVTADKILIFHKQKGAIYKKTIENNRLLPDVLLAAYCDELIPIKDIFIMRKNDRLNILKE
ncbi:MAG: hypothetical protein FWG51_05035 [Firmicutes bacterium]|nr:hypothetical protein [Bacillota bacterium]